MTPDEFAAAVLPRVAAAWDAACLCAQPGFRKLLSFDFRDYDAGPMGLAETETLGNTFIRQRFDRIGDRQDLDSGDSLQKYACPQCGAACEEEFAEFSIAMSRSCFRFTSPGELTPTALYLVGFYGFSRDDFEKVHDFKRTESVAEFLRSIDVGAEA